MPAGAKGDSVGELAVPLGAMKRLLGRLDLALERGLQVGELLVASMEGRRLGHHNLARLTEVVDLACETLLVGRQRLEVPAVLLLEVVEPPAERARERRLVTRGRFCHKGGSGEIASSASRNRTATNAKLTYFDELASSSTSAMVMSRSARSFEMSVSRPWMFCASSRDRRAAVFWRLRSASIIESLAFWPYIWARSRLTSASTSSRAWTSFW
jgi:hypothetical protein